MTEIFIVTAGEYEDYRMERVFSSKDKADEFATLANEHMPPEGPFTVDTWTVTEEVPSPVTKWHVDYDGRSNETREYSRPAWSDQLSGADPEVRTHAIYDGSHLVQATSISLERARKAVTDKVAELGSLNEEREPQ